MVWRKMLFEEFHDGYNSGWPSLISEWNDLSDSWSPFFLEDLHQFSAQVKIWVGRCCL